MLAPPTFIRWGAKTTFLLARENSLFVRQFFESPQLEIPAIPKVSVVMPVRNAGVYLARSIESILQQLFSDFEFVIGDDASDDGSKELIEDFAARDSRIRVLRSEVQLGPARSSKWTAEAARAPLIARMDADDVCHPARLRAQVAALEANLEAVLVASLLQMIDRQGRIIREADYSVLTSRAHLDVPHPSFMYRREAYWAVGGYEPQSDYFEDRVLIERLQSRGDLLVIAAPLLSYRMTGVSARLNDDPVRVEASLTQGDPLSSSGRNKPNGERRISPQVYRSLGSIRIWSYRPAGVLSAMIRRMRLHPLRVAFATLLWAVVITIAPGLARTASRLQVAWRNRRALRHVRPDHLYRWAPNELPHDLGPAGI